MVSFKLVLMIHHTKTSIIIELNIPVVTNGDYGNIHLHSHTSVNLYTNEQCGFASSSVVVINSDIREDPRQEENGSNLMDQ